MLSQDYELQFDQDLRLNFRYDFGKMNSTLGSVVPLAMFFSLGQRLQARAGAFEHELVLCEFLSNLKPSEKDI